MSGAARWPFSHSDEVRFSDLDIMGHLNNVAFLVFVESARVAYFRSRVPGRDSGLPGGFGIVVAEAKIVYHFPGHLGDRIDTLLRPDDIGRTSFRLDFEMRVGERAIADGYAVQVFYDRSGARPAPLPDELRARLAADGARLRAPAGAPLTKL